MAITFEPFCDTDWYSFAGATEFENGDPPLIAHYGLTTLVHDRVGLHVTVAGATPLMAVLECPDRLYGADICEQIVKWLPGKTPAQMKTFFVGNLGFTAC